MKIEAIMFDLDDTLIPSQENVDTALRATCAPVAEKYGVDPDDLRSTVRQTAREIWRAAPTYAYCERVGIASYEGLWMEYFGDEPEIDRLREWAPHYRRQAWTQSLAVYGIDDAELAWRLAERFPVERRKHHAPYAEVLGVMDQLKPSYRFALLTNGAVKLQNEKLDLSGLRPYFEIVLVSGEFAVGKPDPRVFETVLERMNLRATSVVMVGDSLRSDMAGAHNAGIISIWVNRNGGPAEASVPPDFEIRDLIGLENTLSLL